MDNMHTDLPKTINEALKILAYNDFFWDMRPKTPNAQINPHGKDLQTVKSLADSQYAWTEKQAKLAVVILKRYNSKFQKYNMDIKGLLDRPVFDEPFRVIDFEKSVEKYTTEDGQELVEVRFPYNKKLIQLIRNLKDGKGLPVGYANYDGDQKKWIFKQSDVTTYYLNLIAIRYDFKYVDKTFLDDYYTVKNEKIKYKGTNAILQDDKITIMNADESLVEYWNNVCSGKNLLQQLDSLKNFGIPAGGIKIDSLTELGGKIAHSDKTKCWIDKNEYSRDSIINALLELDCFPIVMPVSGDPNSVDDAEEWDHWFRTFERNGIDYKNLAFGFDIKEPKRPQHEDFKFNDNVISSNITDENFETLYDVYQSSRQFKYIDKETKIIFVRNRIPRALMRSKIKPKASLVALGGGYYTAGSDNLKRFLDNLPKTLYYNDHRPSSFDWHDKIIMKL